MATIFAKTASDLTLILPVRTALIQPFAAPDWTNLRLGLWLSITASGNDDDLTGLAEGVGFSTEADRVFIGFKKNNDTRPNNTGTSFIGLGVGHASQSRLQEATKYYWGTNQGGGAGALALVSYDGSTQLVGGSVDGTNPGVLASNATVGSGYAAFYGVKLTRASGATANISTLSVACPTFAHFHAGQFTSTPDIASARSLLASETYRASGSFGGNFATNGVPDAIYIYWPFNNSRLRIHAMVLEKFA